MARKRRGGHNYKFTEKTHSVRGILAIVMAVLSLAACVFMIWTSYQARGAADIYVGSIGVLGFIIALTAVFTSISSIREPETFRAIPYTSLLLSILSAGIWIALYVGGL